jgi:hypothetical protein
MAYDVPTYNVPKENLFKVESKKQKEKKLFLMNIQEKGEITEQELLLIKRRLNDGTYKYEDVQPLFELNDGQGLRLTPEQSAKGKAWLFDKWKTPTGKVRENSPFGYREEELLEGEHEFYLKDFYDDGNVYHKHYEPYYDYGGMEYYVKGGEIQILG